MLYYEYADMQTGMTAYAAIISYESRMRWILAAVRGFRSKI
ncbi:hypothetical protein [Eubacterium sp. An11]|nr:hypothetical protein [Eubacterium sp. An11]